MRLRLTAAVAAIGFLLPGTPAWAAEPKPDAFYAAKTKVDTVAFGAEFRF